MTEPISAIDPWSGAGQAAAAPGTRGDDIRREPPRILLLATLRWPLAARLAIAFAACDCRVEAWCPAGHPLEKTRAVQGAYRRRALAPLRSLRAALERSRPDLAIPCDDAAAHELSALYRSELATREARWCPLIERSLGAPDACRRASARDELMHVAAAQGIRVPEHAQLRGADDLERWGARHGFPAVLKTDGSWGGLGVAVVRDLAQARGAYRRMSRVHALPALRALLFRRDPVQLLRWLEGRRPALSMQRHIQGVPANSALACWHGEVLAGTSVVALRTANDTGPGTVVHPIENEEMAAAGRRLVRALGLSGLCGLDFVIEASTGHAYLIELNPRATPIAHLPLGPGRELPAALRAALRGEAPFAAPAPVPAGTIAMFPGELRRNAHSPYLESGYHDVPWTEPALVRECLVLPWEERGLLARLRARLGRRGAEALSLDRLMRARDAAPEA